MNLVPLFDNVVIKRETAEEKSRGGIFIPDSAKEKPARGKVLAVGPGKDDKPVGVTEGQTVLFTKWAGNELDLDGDTVTIVKAEDIVAVVEPGTMPK